MPFDTDVLPVFLITISVLLVTPGPDVAFVIATGVAEGRRTAMWASIGIASAMFFHAVLAAVGIAAVVATSPLAYDIIRYGGAAYLVYLAYKSFKSKPFKAPGQQTIRSPFENLRRGFLTNLLNPKAILFSGVFLPQFASEQFGPIVPQIISLGALLALCGLGFYTFLSAASGTFGKWLLSSDRRQMLLERVMGVVFLGLAMRLVMLQRRVP